MMDLYNGYEANLVHEAKQTAKFDHEYEKERERLSCSHNVSKSNNDDVLAILSRIESKLDDMNFKIDVIVDAMDICDKSNGTFVVSHNAVKTCLGNIKLSNLNYKTN